MYKAFVRAKSGCDKWHDYEMSVVPYENSKPIYYEFTSCPAAEFAIRHGLTEIIGGMTIYKDTELKAYLEQAGFHEVQIHKKKGWLCITARK